MTRKILLWIVFVGMAMMLIIAILSKSKINDFISGKMKNQNGQETVLSAEEIIRANYNYLSNGLKYDFTLLEFGSQNCTTCKQMEPVLEEIRNSDVVKINVVFIHTMKMENLTLMKYFGISAQPMQILLDKQGKEFFRNYGYISTANLLAKIN